MEFKNIFNNGHIRLANSINRCNRLDNLPRRMLLEVLNQQNIDISNATKNGGVIEDHDLVKINRLKLESFLDDSSYKVIFNTVQKLIKTNFIKSFSTQGRNYIFKLCSDIENNPLILLSEVDQLFLNKYLSEFTTYTKIEKVKSVVKNFRSKNKDDGFILKLKFSTSKEDIEEILNDYIDTLTDVVSSIDVDIKKEKFCFKNEDENKKIGSISKSKYRPKNGIVPDSKYSDDMALTQEEFLAQFENEE